MLRAAGRSHTAIIATLAGLGMALGPAAIQATGVENGSFEKGSSGWRGLDSQVDVVQTSDAPDGARLAEVRGDRARPFALTSTRPTVSRLTSRERVTATASVRAARPGSVGRRAVVRLRQRTQSGAFVQAWSRSVRLGTQFSKVDVSADVEVAGGSIDLVIGHANSRGAFQVDGVEVVRGRAQSPKPVLRDSFEAGARDWTGRRARLTTRRLADAPDKQFVALVRHDGSRKRGYSLRSNQTPRLAAGKYRVSLLARGRGRSIGDALRLRPVVRNASGKRVRTRASRTRLTRTFRPVNAVVSVPKGGTLEVLVASPSGQRGDRFALDAVRVVPVSLSGSSASRTPAKQTQAAASSEQTGADAPAPSAAPPAPQATPPPPSPDPPPATSPGPPPPVTWENRPYGQADWLYSPRPEPFPVDPNSNAMVAAMWSSYSSSRPVMTATGETPPIYESTAADPLYTIDIKGKGHQLDGAQVRLPAHAQTGTGADHPLIVLDSSSHTEARFWQATVDHGSRTVRASSGGLFDYGPNGDGLPFLGNGVGSGLSYMNGMIRPEDVQRGRIDHALRFAADFINGDNRFPATGSDQWGNSPVPMGSRFYLDVSAAECDARTVPGTGPNAVGATSFLRMICHALREHGMYAADGAPLIVFTMENDATANWSDVGVEELFGNYGWILRDQHTSVDGLGPRNPTDGLPWDRFVARADTGEGYNY